MRALGPTRAIGWLVGLALGGCYLSHERAPDPSPPRDSECRVALLPGSPAPMPGYCPAHANRSLFEIIDHAPVLRWRLAVPEAPGTSGPIVVGPHGRIYLTASTTLLAIDDAGTSGNVAWRADLGASVSAPVLLADGTVLLIVRPDAARREAVWLSEDGEVRRRAPLPDGLRGHPLVGEHGALFFVATGTDREARVLVALEPTGALRWSREIASTVSGLALGPQDRLVAATYLVTDEPSPTRDGWLRTEIAIESIDGASGEEAYRVLVDRDGAVTAGPALGPDGTSFVVAWVDGYRAAALVSATPDGSSRRTMLADSPIGGGPSSLAVGGDGRVVLKEGQSLLAFDPLGSVLWRRDVHLNFDVGGTVDPVGGVLIHHGLASGDDGAELWVSDIPVHREGDTFFFPGPMVVGDEVLYYMASETQLWAVGAPL